jgi:hypothetical protein
MRFTALPGKVLVVLALPISLHRRALPLVRHDATLLMGNQRRIVAPIPS